MERQKATEANAYQGGRPSFTRSQMKTVRDILAQDAGVSVIAKAKWLSRQTIDRLKDDPGEAELRW